MRLASHVQRGTHIRSTVGSGVEQVSSQAGGEETAHSVDTNAHPSVEVVERSGGSSVSVDAVQGLVDEGFLCSIGAD